MKTKRGIEWYQSKAYDLQYIGFKLADPEIVTALRIFHTF
jgi:hypothetical protein